MSPHDAVSDADDAEEPNLRHQKKPLKIKAPFPLDTNDAVDAVDFKKYQIRRSKGVYGVCTALSGYLLGKYGIFRHRRHQSQPEKEI